MKALILNGSVVQASSAVFPVAAPLTWVTCSDDVRAGWSYNGSAFAAPPQSPPIVPATVSPLQARKALRAADLKDAVDAWLAVQTDEVQETWEYCIAVERSNPTIAAAAAALGLTASDIDQLFISAAAL